MSTTNNNGFALHAAVKSETHTTVSGDIAIDPPCRRIRVGTGGDLEVQYEDGTTDTIPSLLDGESVDVRAVKIVDAGTTAAKVTIFW